MIPIHSLQTAYCFLHQKRNVCLHSTLDWQKDDIEYAIAEYADAMDKQLLIMLAQGRKDFLKEHTCFRADIDSAVAQLEAMLHQAQAQTLTERRSIQQEPGIRRPLDGSNAETAPE